MPLSTSLGLSISNPAGRWSTRRRRPSRPVASVTFSTVAKRVLAHLLEVRGRPVEPEVAALDRVALGDGRLEAVGLPVTLSTTWAAAAPVPIVTGFCASAASL